MASGQTQKSAVVTGITNVVNSVLGLIGVNTANRNANQGAYTNVPTYTEKDDTMEIVIISLVALIIIVIIAMALFRKRKK